MSKKNLKNKKYFIDKHMRYCYPCCTSEVTASYGVLSEYMDKEYDRDGIDKVICELIMKHPYIEGAMFLEVSICWTDGSVEGYYHHLNFGNDDCEEQERNNSEIKYEKG